MSPAAGDSDAAVRPGPAVLPGSPGGGPSRHCLASGLLPLTVGRAPCHPQRSGQARVAAQGRGVKGAELVAERGPRVLVLRAAWLSPCFGEVEASGG